jgi:hypothetical protein
MRKFAPLVALLSLLLAGCYSSTKMLLDPQAARQPWPSSTWSETHNGAVKHYRATKRSDGWYDYGQLHADTGKWEVRKVLLNDLGTVNGRTLYVYAMQSAPGDNGQSVLYGIIVTLPAGKWKAVTPDCSLDVPKAIAKAHHVEENNCMFSDRSQLLGALRDYAATPEFEQVLATP